MKKDIAYLSFSKVRLFHLLWYILSHVFERFVSAWLWVFFFYYRTFAWPTNHVSIICSQLLLCISSAVSYTFQPHCWINKCHRLLQSGTYPINFATWKTIWNEINSRDVQTTSMVCYATTAHFNTASIFLFNYFFFTCSNWICFSTFNHDLFKSHSAKPSHSLRTTGNTWCTTHFAHL